jgi:hypothetical protein
MEYKVLEAGSRDEIERMVAEHIAEGWAPLGGIYVMSQTALVWRFFQAMVRTEKAARG